MTCFFLSCCSGPFPQFCRDLHSAVPTTCLWAAGVRSDVSSLPGFVRREASLTTCLRSPPSVQRQVQASHIIDGSYVPHYSSSSWPAPTDGPAVHWLPHHGQPSHAGGPAQDCQQCGHDIGRLLHHLGVGRSGRCHAITHFTCCTAFSDTNQGCQSSAFFGGGGTFCLFKNDFPLFLKRHRQNKKKRKEKPVSDTGRVQKALVNNHWRLGVCFFRFRSKFESMVSPLGTEYLTPAAILRVVLRRKTVLTLAQLSSD